MRLLSGKSSVLVFALLAWPAIALAQTATVVQSNSVFATGGTDPSVSFPSNNTAGNLLWVAVGSDAPITTPTDTLGNTYTLAIGVTGSGGSGNAAIYYAASAVAGANTVTCNHSGNGNTHCHIAEISGLVTSSPLDRTGSVASSSGCAVSTSAATTQGNEWVGAFFYDSPNNKTLIAGTGYSKVQLSSNSSAGDSALSESQNVGSTGVQTAICGGNSGNVLSQLITTFKASGAGTGPFISSLTPTSGSAGTAVTITGSNFGTPQGRSTVTFNGTTAIPTSWSSTSVVVPVPSGATTGNVVVTVAGSGSNGVNFTVPPGPAIVVQSKSGFATGGTNPAVTFPSKNTAGNLLWVAVGSDAAITTPSDTLGNTYVLAVKATGSGGSGNAAIYYAASARAGTNTVTCNHSGNGNTHCHIAEISGLITSAPLDQTGSVASSAGCAVSTSAATIQANEWVAAFFYDSPTNKTLTAGNGYTKIQLSNNSSSGDSALSESQDVTSAAVQTATCSGNSSNVLSQLITTFIAQNNTANPVITDFNPKTVSAGSLVTISGSNFIPASGGSPQVTLNSLGGGSIAAPVASFTATSIVFVVPAGAATGNITVTAGNQSGTSAAALTIVAPTSFTLTAGPSTASLIQGQSTSYAVTLNSVNGFNQLAALNLLGLPPGLTATFNPAQITAGQTAVLTISAPANQSTGSANLTISASAVMSGIALTQSASVTLNVQPVSTSFMGRTTVDDAMQTPLAGVVVAFMGQDGMGGTTSCSGQTQSDQAGNFSFFNLPQGCAGEQLIRYDGSKASTAKDRNAGISPVYAGVDLLYNFAANTVTTPTNLIRLPRVDDKETVLVNQNSSDDQTFSFKTIPGLSVTVYAGTVFTLADGSQPNPFPLIAINVPVDRLPDEMPLGNSTVMPFIVAFQPANSVASQPVAVTFPNTLNTPPGVNVELDTLNPTIGMMVRYGTGTVSGDGTQIIPDLDPAHPSHQYGLVHFDWHGQQTQPPNGNNPSPGGGSACGCDTAGNPIDLASGLETETATDIAINSPRGPISIHRIFRTGSNNPGPFGIGTSLQYGYQLGVLGFLRGQQVVTLVVPDGNQFPLSAQPDGTFTNSTIPSLRGAVLRNVLSGAATLRWKDGTTYTFQPPPGQGIATLFLSSISDANGNTITLTLGSSGQIMQITDPVERSLTLNYDQFSRVMSVVDPIGRTVQYTYNNQGTLASVADSNGGVTQYGYDGQNNLISVTDARGVTITQNSYDANGRVIQQVRGDGGTFNIHYDLLNGGNSPTLPVVHAQITDPVGNVTHHRFSPTGLLTDMVDAAGQLRTINRDPQNNNIVNSVTGAGACAVCPPVTAGDYTSVLDQNGDVLSRTDALGNTTSFTYDPTFNKVTSIKDPLGNISTFTYDPSGNLLTSTDANGHTTTFTYSPFGEVTTITDPLQHTAQFSYDAFGNLVSVTDTLGKVTSMAYDGVSRPVLTMNALGRKSLTAYDALDRVASRTDGNGNTTQFSYDAIGNLLSVKDARGNLTTFTYDSMNRLLTRTDPLGKTDSRTYDKNGDLVQFVDRRGQTSRFSYDPLNRLSQESYQDGGTVSRVYDANSRLIQANDSASGVFEFAYDAAGRLLNSANPIGTVQYTYDASGRTRSRQVAGQPTLQYSYDPVGNLLSATLPQASVTIAYNAKNQIDTIRRANGISSQYQYDPVGRLIALVHSGPGGVIDAQSYTYDAVGNRVFYAANLAQPLTTQGVTNSTLDPANRLLQRDAASFAYDANGNLSTKTDPAGSTLFTWDARNRLESFSGSGGQANFKYDFAGNLISQFVNGRSRTYLLDDLTNLAAFNDNGEAEQVLSGRFIDQHIAITDSSGQTQYSLTDSLNSTIAVVDGQGKQISAFSYEPFGQVRPSMATQIVQFTGRTPILADLYYYRSRYYAPDLGRFISEDPIGFNSGDFNLYRYALNSPFLLTDPMGLEGWFSRWAREADEQANELADLGNTPAALAAEAVSVLEQAALFTPLGQEIDILSDPCKGTFQKIGEVALAIGLEGASDALGELKTAYRPFSGYGLDRSVMGVLAHSTFRINKGLAAVYSFGDIAKTGAEVFEKTRQPPGTGCGCK